MENLNIDKSKKIIAFDLDGTLAPSKSQIPEKLCVEFAKLLEHKKVCVISGGKFGQFEKQILSQLKVDSKLFDNLHLMPTCGTRYYKYDQATQEWKLVYAEDIAAADKQMIIDALNKGFDTLGYRVEKTYGDTVEDRESQITYSVFGQNIVDELGPEGVRIKEEWDPDNSKKKQLRDFIAPLIPNYEVRVGGSTSIDVTKPGIDKAYGMNKLMKILNAQMSDVLFVGDKMQEGGNDYPVKAMGIDSIEVKGWEDTYEIVKKINELGD